MIFTRTDPQHIEEPQRCPHCGVRAGRAHKELLRPLTVHPDELAQRWISLAQKWKDAKDR